MVRAFLRFLCFDWTKVFLISTAFLRDRCRAKSLASQSSDRLTAFTTMATFTPPELDQSIQRLKILSRNLSSHSPKILAELYLASIALLVNLKSDQSTLRQASNDNVPCPPSESIPAISAILQDASLFRALLRCLQSGASLACGGDMEAPEARSGPSHPVVSRKRSLSFSVDADRMANKNIKLTHSPVPGTRHGHKVFMDAGKRKPSWNIQAMAAAVLYTSLQHLDHWPAPLMKAYADDCFGPRLWVDDPRCKLLVNNLALAHSAEHANAGDDLLHDASKVANAYRQFEQLPPEENADDSDAPFQPQSRRGSLGASSTGSGHLYRTTSAESLTNSSLVKPKPFVNKNGDDSDSGDEEEECLLDSAVGNIAKRSDDDDDSSSGEEDEEVVVTTKSNGNDKMDVDIENGISAAASSDNGVSPPAEALYPIVQSNVDLTRVRQRFFGDNLAYAHESISGSLLERLDVKSKQNSGLLQSLPLFTAIPGVRYLIATSLEKWLQSPALAGLARTLFASTVNSMKNVDPPLEEDLNTIDCVLAMNLKANQFNAHLENVTVIAKRIPTASVANHMYFKLLRDTLTVPDTVATTISDQLKMIAAIHRAVPPRISYEALAASLLMMLVSPPENMMAGDKMQRSERYRLVKRLRFIIRTLASELRPTFDGCLLMESLLSFDVSSDSWSARDEEDKARLMFQCVTLFASSSFGSVDTKKNNGKSAGATDASSDKSFTKSLVTARKLLLAWCCTDYGPRWASRRNRKRTVSDRESGLLAGAGIPDYSSALGPQVEEKIPSWLNTLRCLMFIEDADSSLMKRFIVPDGEAEDQMDWQEERTRIQKCCEHGVTLDNEMVWVVLKSCNTSEGGMSSEMAIQLLEHLFEACSVSRGGSLSVSDPILVWELYNLVEYTPDKPVGKAYLSDDDGSESSEKADQKVLTDVPRLANPGLWWRVTMLALIMSAMSPDRIGAVVWKEHPTLRALMKMITSGRYRFPTVDCDEKMREDMKQCEQEAREMETKIAEHLFLPPRRDNKNSKKMGSRVSRRLQKQQKEKEAAKELAEFNRRKKMLRAAQKSIMLWNPVGPARKPPRESADLLMSVEERFALSEVLQRSVNPDFVLLTIGQTSRGAIELAYDWLIPIISRLPGTIDRLPSSASCFLLLRAYGTGGEERKQLRELSAPLLCHVQDSLRGRLGESDAVKAFDLLMADFASHNPDRRRCARRVLYDSLVQLDDPASVSNGSSSWMLNILRVEHATSLVDKAIKHMSTAAAFERGTVLCSLIMALEKHIAFAKTHQIKVETTSFSRLLVKLISNRQSVYAETMDTFTELRSTAIRVTHEEFVRCGKNQLDETETAGVVEMKLFPSSFLQTEEVKLPLFLLQSISVLLSIWKDHTNGEGRDETASGAVDDLVGSLMRSSEEEGTELREDDSVGLAGAKMADSSSAAVTIESWIMLAKARSDSIARRAALSAPAKFLPRLLLCSGLPRASLLTMIDRLGRIGDTAAEKNEVYLRLLDPSTSSEWDIGRVGHRREVSRKLLGRLSAYLRLNEVSCQQGESQVSTAFLDWLSDTCKTQYQKPKKAKPKKGKAIASPPASSLAQASSLLATLTGEDLGLGVPVKNLLEKPSDKTDFVSSVETAADLPSVGDSMESTTATIESAVEKHEWRRLDLWLQDKLFDLQTNDIATDGKRNALAVSIQLLQSLRNKSRNETGLQSIALKWIPLLSVSRGSIELWQLLFSSAECPAASVADTLVSRCIKSWSQRHATSCCDWIISKSGPISEEYNLSHMVRFLVSTSGLSSIQIEGLPAADGTVTGASWYKSADSVRAASVLALECSKLETDCHSENRDVQHWVALLLLLAAQGKEQLHSVSNAILQGNPGSETNANGAAQQAAMLRLYLCHPNEMSLSNPAIRDVLTKATKEHGKDWLSWRSSTDDHLLGILFGVTTGDLKLARPLSDLARKHPLLILRLLPQMTRFAQADGAIGVKTTGDNRGVVYGRSLLGPREARIAGRAVQVTTRHWGFNYTEPIWVTLLDVVLLVHQEVLFTCGPSTGLLDFLTVYLELVSVQLQLRTADKAARLKSKLATLFTAFKQANAQAWSGWLSREVGELEIRHMLMSVDFITPTEAVESLKTS